MAQHHAGEFPPAPQAGPAASHDWFHRLAEDKILPILKIAAAFAEKHSAQASVHLTQADGKTKAEMIISPAGLPAGARPPHLTIQAAETVHRLSVDVTGTFPHAGATGGFGAEIDYNTIYPEQVQDAVDAFMALVFD